MLCRKYILIYIFCIIMLVGSSSAVWWIGIKPGGFQDDFNRANSSNLNVNWARTGGAANSNASIKNGTLYINMSNDMANALIVRAKTHVNASHPKLELSHRTEGGALIQNAYVELRILNDAGTDTIQTIWFNKTNIILCDVDDNGYTKNSSNYRRITNGKWNTTLLKFNYTTGKIEWFMNGTGMGNVSFHAPASKWGGLRFIGDVTGEAINLSVNWIQWGTDQGLLNMYDCHVTPAGMTRIFNFTLVDEELTTIVTGNISVDIILTSKTDPNNFSHYSNTNKSVKELGVCVKNNLLTIGGEYWVDVMADFDATGKVKEFYYIQDETMSQSKKRNITLYDLKTTDSTSFLFQFVDENNNPVKDGIIKTYRKYIGDSLWHPVEISWLDENGETITHLQEEEAIYYFEAWKNGVLLLNSSETLALCQAVPCTLRYSQAAAGLTQISGDWDRASDGWYRWGFNRATRIVNLTFNYINKHESNITVYRYSGNQSIMDDAINSSWLNATSGTLQVTIPASYGNRTYYVTYYRHGSGAVILDAEWINLLQEGATMMGNTGIIMSALIILSLGLMAISSGVWMFVFIFLGFFMVMVMGFMHFTYEALGGLIAAGVILIIKLLKRSR